MFSSKVDLAYWKDWDKNTMEVKIIERDDLTASEVVHWVYRFPVCIYTFRVESANCSQVVHEFFLIPRLFKI